MPTGERIQKKSVLTMQCFHPIGSLFCRCCLSRRSRQQRRGRWLKVVLAPNFRRIRPKEHRNHCFGERAAWEARAREADMRAPDFFTKSTKSRSLKSERSLLDQRPSRRRTHRRTARRACAFSGPVALSPATYVSARRLWTPRIKYRLV